MGENPEDVSIWDTFWNYFERTWKRLYKPEWWNISSLMRKRDQTELINLTNNPLERFNRTLNEACSHKRPSMLEFVGIIKDQSRKIIQMADDIDLRRKSKTERSEIVIPKIPKEYKAFKIAS